MLNIRKNEGTVLDPAVVFRQDGAMLRASVVHHVPGRMRLRSPALKGDVFAIADLRSGFTEIAGITAVTANACTGSVLLESGDCVAGRACRSAGHPWPDETGSRGSRRNRQSMGGSPGQRSQGLGYECARRTARIFADPLVGIEGRRCRTRPGAAAERGSDAVAIFAIPKARERSIGMPIGLRCFRGGQLRPAKAGPAQRLRFASLRYERACSLFAAPLSGSGWKDQRPSGRL